MALPPPDETRSRDAAVARWCHALRSPLNALLTATAVLEAAPPDSRDSAEARRIIARQARNLAWLISDLPGRDEPRA